MRNALKEQAYPWYDGQKDEVRPLLPDTSSWTSWLSKRVEAFFDWLDRRFGKSSSEASGANASSVRGGLATILFLAAGFALLVMLWQLWRIHTPQVSTALNSGPRIGDAARIAGLAQGVAMEGLDPWAEALGRRAAGDSAGAVIWLFLDQLMSLQRAGLVRLTPGRTVRQYASGLDDPLLADGLRTTLGVFEAVYYGHRLPGPEELERVWSRAETFRSRLQAINVD